MRFHPRYALCFAFGCLLAGAGVPAAGQLQVSYGTVVVQGEPTGTTVRSLFVTNLYQSFVTISQTINQAPSSSHSFVATGTCGATTVLPPQGRCRVDIGLVSPGVEVPWSYSAALIIESNVEPPIFVSLIGQVCFVMDCDFLTRFLGDRVQPKYLDFPPQGVGGSFGPLTLMTFDYEGHVGNEFTASLRGEDADSFQVVGVRCSERVDRPDCAFDIMFTPRHEGPLAAELVIFGPYASVPAIFSVTGQGISPSADALDAVQMAYIADYGRPADPAGQAYWASRVDAEGGSLDAIIAAFGKSDEFNRRYAGLSSSALVTKIYQQTLNREPDPAGLAYYVGEMQAGRRTLQTITLDVLNGAKTAPDSTVVVNKFDVAAYYTSKVAEGCPYGTEQDGVNIISNVTDAGTAAAAKAIIDNRCGS